jgi:8-oxo-dGTP pyrophosphatase MutT (NUDIX family)
VARPSETFDGAAQRRAAVALVLDAAGDVLLIRRADFEGDPWSGHVALPGGRVETEDDSHLSAAIRETLEEVGLSLNPAQALGTLDDVPSPGMGPPRVVVRPFVFAVERFDPLRPNEEVASVHPFALSALLDNVGRGPMAYEHRGQVFTLPRVDFDGQRLWGMTLRVVDDLLHRLDGRGLGLKRL